MASSTDEELHAQVKSIVDELEAVASGSLYDIDGNYVVIDDIDDWKEEQYKKKVDEFGKEHPIDSFDYQETGFDTYKEWMEDEIGTADDIDEPDEVFLSDYIEKECLGDIRFEVDSSMELHGGKMLFCYGGPTVWVADDEVRGYWGSSRVEMSLDSDTRSMLLGWFEKMWNIAKG